MRHPTRCMVLQVEAFIGRPQVTEHTL